MIGSFYLDNEEVDLNDPFVNAEKELREVSALIQETARKLTILKPRGSVSKVFLHTADTSG